MRNDPDRIDPQVWKIACVVILAPLMSQLDSTVVNVSLSTLANDLDTTLTTIQWVSSGYLLAMALTLPLSGWLIDRLGAKRVYIICFSIFTLTSLLCGLATSAGSLILFRVLQGMAGGVLTPMSQMMMARTAGRHMARVMGVAVMPVMIGPILGPTLAGLILQHAGWPWIFLVNLPVGALALYLAWRVLPVDGQYRVRRSFDILGFLLLSPALAMLLHGLETVANRDGHVGNGTWFELLAGAVLLALFLLNSLQHRDRALIDIWLFAKRTFRASALTQFMSNTLTYGGQLLFPLYLIMAKGYTPARAGIVLAAMGIGLICAVPFMGRLTARFGSRPVSTGGAVVALLGTLPFVLVGVHDMSDLEVIVFLWLRGTGLGSINIPSMSSAYADVPKTQLPAATTALNIVQRLGGPIGTTCIALWLHTSLEAHAAQVATAFSSTFIFFTLLHAVAVLAASRIPPRKTRKPAPAEAVVEAAD
jgi:EmrB/QacA subfamily drug resistance transporter